MKSIIHWLLTRSNIVKDLDCLDYLIISNYITFLLKSMYCFSNITHKTIMGCLYSESLLKFQPMYVI